MAGSEKVQGYLAFISEHTFTYLARQEAHPIPVFLTTVGKISAEYKNAVPNEKVTHVFPMMAMVMAIQS